MNNLIELLQDQNLVWQGSASHITDELCASGYPELDAKLDGGFYPQGVTEILSDFGVGELRLLMPMLAEASEQERLVVFVAPNGTITAESLLSEGIDTDKVLIIYPETQQQVLWTAEQCLKSGACHSVLLWSQAELEIHQIKRLQLAANKGNSRQFLLRADKYESLSLPFDLSLSIKPHLSGVTAKINKRKLGWPSDVFQIDMAERWPDLSLPAIPNNLVPFSRVNTG